MTTTPKVSPAADPRDLRTIILGIEATVEATRGELQRRPLAEAEPKKKPARVLHYPVRLSDMAQTALDIVLSNIKARAEVDGKVTKLDYTAIINACNTVEAGCMRAGGDTNESIRARCAEILGVDVRWAL